MKIYSPFKINNCKILKTNCFFQYQAYNLKKKKTHFSEIIYCVYYD